MATVSGTTKDASGAFIARKVRLYRRSDGALAGETTSNATTGAYSITALDTTPHFVVEHDGEPIVGDQYIGNVIVGLHMDGANGSTTFTDIKGNAFTALGGAQISTAQYAPLTGNASSLQLSASGDGVKASSSSVGGLGSGDFSVSLAVRFSAYPTINGGGRYESTLIGKTFNDDDWVLMATGGPSSISGLMFRIRQNPWPETSVAHSFALNTWYRIEVTRVSGVLYFFVDGVRKNAGGTAFAQAITNSSSPLVIGRGEMTNYTNQTYGYIDDVLVTYGIGRHTETYTPSTVPFYDAASGIAAPVENALILDYITPA